MMQIARVVAAALLAGVAACEQNPADVAAPAAVAVYFVEREAGVGPVHTRMIVTPEFLRIDGGEVGGDFTLYHRAQRTIYNVSRTDSLILVIAPRPVHPPPLRLKHTIERDTDGAPDVGGRPVVHYRLRTNGELCYDLYAADGLLPEVVAALREYREALAGEQAAGLDVTPREMQTPCDLANNVTLPARHLAHGLPVRLTETGGRSRGRERVTELADYDTEFDADASLFDLPASYRRRTIQELRGR